MPSLISRHAKKFLSALYKIEAFQDFRLCPLKNHAIRYIIIINILFFMRKARDLMLDSFIYTVNTVVPIFLLVLIGLLLKRKGFLSEGFVADSDRFVFKIALPVYLFAEISSAELSAMLDVPLLLFCVAGVIVTVLLGFLIVPLCVKGNDKRGAFIQGIYRSNSAILGIMMARSMFGETGVEKIALILPVTIILYNICAVVILSVFAPQDTKLTPVQMTKRILLDIVKNPLIIAIVAAIPLMLLEIKLPQFTTQTLDYIGSMATPLALISLGANFTLDSLKKKYSLALAASLVKTALLPLVTVVVGILLGFRDISLGIILIFFGGPAAVSSYIMAKNMKSDHELAGQILLLSTICCIFTFFTGIFILKSTGMI